MAPQKWKLTLWCGLVFAGAQVAPGPRPINPPVQPERTIHANLHVPEQIANMLGRACMDCHSNQTRWPWYGRMAPGSWLLHRDVARGRRAMNLSEWPKPRASMGLLVAACADVQSGRMPLPQYLLLHPSAKLSPEEKKTFCDWTAAELARLRPTTRASKPPVIAYGRPPAP